MRKLKWGILVVLTAWESHGNAAGQIAPHQIRILKIQHWQATLTVACISLTDARSAAFAFCLRASSFFIDFATFTKWLSSRHPSSSPGSIRMRRYANFAQWMRIQNPPRLLFFLNYKRFRAQIGEDDSIIRANTNIKNSHWFWLEGECTRDFSSDIIRQELRKDRMLKLFERANRIVRNIIIWNACKKWAKVQFFCS